MGTANRGGAPPIELRAGSTLRLRVEEGETLRMELLAAEQFISMSSLDAADEQSRLSMYTTQAMNHRWRLSVGDVLLDTECRVVWTIAQDAAGSVYAGGGSCGAFLDVGDGSPTHEHCSTALVPQETVTPDVQLGPDAFFSPFALPTYQADGRWRVTPAGRRGDVLVIRAHLAQDVVVTLCPHVPPKSDRLTVGAVVRVGPPEGAP